MMKWLLIASQLFAMKKSFSKTHSAVDYVEENLTKARGYFVFTIGCVVASLFLLISVVVAIISAGLQIEKQGFLSFSGLMISASIFFAIAIVGYLISFISLSIQKQKMLERARLKEQLRNEHAPLNHWVEEILKQILTNVTKSKDDVHGQAETSGKSET